MSQPQLGQRLRAVRLANGYTTSQLALLSGLSKPFLSMLENGHTTISATRLHTLAGVFGLATTDSSAKRTTIAENEMPKTPRRANKRVGRASPAPGQRFVATRFRFWKAAAL